MSAVRLEAIQHNSREEVLEWLTQAVAIVDEVYWESDAPEGVVVKVLELLAARTVVTAQPQQTSMSPEQVQALLRGGRPF